jgi:hypothetical protein
MYEDLIKPGLGRVCDYCNISKGRSIVFSSMHKYADHWYENHRDFDIYASDKDLDRFFLQFKRDYERKLRDWQKQQLEYSGRTFTWRIQHHYQEGKPKHKRKQPAFTKVKDFAETPPEKKDSWRFHIKLISGAN